jgi:hypothetical protein
MTDARTTDRLPTNPSDLAFLMSELDEQAKPGEPDPSLALWEQLHEQEGYDVASPLWRDACNYYDHYFAGDGETED